VRVGFLGPEGTFSHQALLASAGPVAADEAVPLPSNHDVVVAVQEGRVDAAVAPIESAREGAVAAVLDALVFDAPDVHVIGEQVLPVVHCLAARPGVGLADVRTIASHPQAIAQCAGFLRRVLPKAATIAATSTADAIRSLTVEGVSEVVADAAIGTRLAAERYGAEVLREGIEDDPDNATRFVWLSRTPVVAEAGARGGKTSVLFHGPDGDATPGWLVRCLSEFAFRGVNLTKIESRPLRSQLGHYLFHVDLDGRVEDAPVAAALDALRAHCAEVRVLGSYAVADPPVRPATLRGGHGGLHSI
jgi:prephenate dehydratase